MDSKLDSREPQPPGRIRRRSSKHTSRSPRSDQILLQKIHILSVSNKNERVNVIDPTAPGKYGVAVTLMRRPLSNHDKENDMLDPVGFSRLETVHISSTDDDSIDWLASFAAYGGHGADNTVVVPFSIVPGGHLGWHTDSLEETQYIISGSGELQRDDGSFPVGPGSIFILTKDARHDLLNTGTEPLVAIAFFSGPALRQDFDDTMLPVNGYVLASPNATD